MGKYIIELERGETAYKTVDLNGTPLIQLLDPLPYTEPDFDAVKKEVHDKCMGEAEDLAYKLYSPKIDEAYQRGLNDAWDVAKKISTMDSPTRDEIFGLVITSNIIDENSASECIEKIRQYEESKEKHTWICSEVNEPSVDTTLICSKCGYAIKIKPQETPGLNFCPKCGDCKKPKE